MLLASSGACTFILDTPGELSTTCAIESAEGYCGACIVAACAPLLNTCCGDAACAPLLDTVDDCADEFDEQYAYASDASVCAPLTEVDEDPGSALKKCIAVSCSEQCGLGELTSQSSGSDCSGGYVNACQCTGTGDAPGNLAECAPPPGGAKCCAYQAYPALETHCECRWIGCAPTADGCACSTSSEGSADRCDGRLCCEGKYGGSDCRCTDDPLGQCDSIEVPVASCTPATSLECPEGEVEVTSCSVRRQP